MKYQLTIIILGVIVGVFPLLHLPTAWETVLHICLAILLISTGIVIHQYRNRANPVNPVLSVRKSHVEVPTQETKEKYTTVDSTHSQNSSTGSEVLESLISQSSESGVIKGRRRVIRS